MKFPPQVVIFPFNVDFGAVLVVAAIPVLCGAGYYLGALAAGSLGTRAEFPTVNGLYIDPGSLDVGEVWEDPEYHVPLTVKNLGSQTQTIVDFQPSCHCVDIEPRNLIVPANQSVRLTVALDLTRRTPDQVGLARRPLLVSLRPVFQGDFGAASGWELRASVRSRVSLESAQIAFADQCTRGGTAVWRKVKATAHFPLERLEVYAPPEIADVRSEPLAHDPGKYIILVSPRPSLPAGPFQFQVQVDAVEAGGSTHRCASIEAYGEMQPPVQVFPRMLLLGEHRVGTRVEADVCLHLPTTGPSATSVPDQLPTAESKLAFLPDEDPGARPALDLNLDLERKRYGQWFVDHIETAGPGTIVKEGGTQPDGVVMLHVTQNIEHPGDQTSRVRVVVRNPNRELEPITIEIRYHGITKKLP
jgi:hypothetical protein